MGRKPKIIPHIPGTLDSIAEAIFAKNKAKRRERKKKETKGSVRIGSAASSE